MSMHLEGPGLTTTSYKKRKEKITKAKQQELEQGWKERNVRLKQMGLQKETFEQYMEWVYGRGKKTKETTDNRQKTSQAVAKETAKSKKDMQVNILPEEKTKKPWIVGPVSSPAKKTYTGEKVIGIAVMHKSNLVPIFSDEEAVEVSKMRRG